MKTGVPQKSPDISAVGVKVAGEEAAGVPECGH